VASAPAGGGAVGRSRRPDRGFDAIVVREYERAFYGDQLANLVSTTPEN
jgi:hypothetical protein